MSARLLCVRTFPTQECDGAKTCITTTEGTGQFVVRVAGCGRVAFFLRPRRRRRRRRCVLSGARDEAVCSPPPADSAWL